MLFLASIIFPEPPIRSNDLNSQEPSWQTVIGGIAVSPCVETSYGIAVLSDGRLLSACTNSGKVIWQRGIKGRTSPYISAFGDFLYVVTDGSKLNLVNPSGLTLWTAVCPFQIADFPVTGWDGRVFVRGKKSVACYGLDGKRKWTRDIAEMGSIPICTLDDGSILCFLKNPKGKMGVATRLSPFGEKLEDVTFSAVVSSAQNCDKGILVSLKNGSLGLVTVKDGSADSKWVQGSGYSSGAFKICWSEASGNAAFFFQSGSKTEALIASCEDGEILNRFQVGNIATSDFKIARATKSGYFISGSYSACEFGEDGTIIYVANLPPSNQWSSMFYTKKNFIILCMKDWSMKGFLMNQSTKTSSNPQKKPASKKASPISYVKAVEYDETAASLGLRPLSDEKMAEISQAFEKGDYGQKEEEYLSLLKTEALSYIKSGSMKPVFQKENSNFFEQNAVFTQNLLYLMSKTGTREFPYFFSQLLSSELDLSQFLSIITFGGKCGYDEDGLMLLAIEALVVKRIQSSDISALKAVCDATFEICRFMGRPALNKRGKNILSRIMYPQYDKTAREYARKTLEKMITLEKK